VGKHTPTESQGLSVLSETRLLLSVFNESPIRPRSRWEKDVLVSTVVLSVVVLILASRSPHGSEALATHQLLRHIFGRRLGSCC
jgi:hypothetical protein